MTAPSLKPSDVSIDRFGSIGNFFTSPQVTPLFPCIGFCQYGSVPPSSLRLSEQTTRPFSFSGDPSTVYRIPVLNEAGGFYALSKCSHDQVTISNEEYRCLLDWMQLSFASYLAGDMISESQAVRELKPDKAAGLPWSSWGLTKKGDVVTYLAEKNGFENELLTDAQCSVIYKELEKDFDDYLSIAKLTEKDEIREDENPRGFWPMPTQAIVTGNHLYCGQNNRFISHVGKHPITIGLSIPGGQVITLFSSLRKFSAKGVGAGDGSSFDAYFPTWAVNLICELRGLYLPAEQQARNIRYYEQVYLGFVNVSGLVYKVWCNRSGHTNTAMDNSLLQVMMFYLAAIRAGMSFEQVRNNLLCFANGDDIIWASKEPAKSVFSPLNMISVARSVGVYWLCEHEQLMTVFDCSFLSMRPVYRRYPSKPNAPLFELYKFKRDKLICSSRYWKAATTEYDMIAKLVSLVILSFGDEEFYESARKEALAFVLKILSEKPELRERTSSLLYILVDDTSIFKLYTGIETKSGSLDLSKVLDQF